MDNTNLIKKIKEGITKSGFPLELKIGSILEKNKWSYSMREIYEDFETGKFREANISARKTVNGIAINLFVECKKSTDKQLVLYAPKENKVPFFVPIWLKLFPQIYFGKSLPYSAKKIFNEFSKLPHFDMKIPLSKNLIVTKEDTVTQENIDYLNSINGLIKQSVHTGSNGDLETNFRSLYLYILVFDGHLFQLSNSQTEDLDINEISYGQIEYNNFMQNEDQYKKIVNNDLTKAANKFLTNYIIDVMTPEYFEKYLQNIISAVSQIDVKNLEGWGDVWPSIELEIN